VASGWAKVWDSTVGWRGAFMQYNSLTFNTNFSEIRNLTISGGDVALLMAGAPQSIIENVQTSGYQPIGIWLADNCYHAVVRDCYLQTQKFSAFISSGHSGDLLVENVHAAFQTGFGFIGWLLQDTVKFLRCYVDGTMLGGFIFGGNDVNSTVSLDSVTVGSESGVSPSYYVAVAFSSQGTLSIRDSNFSQYVPLPCVVVANPPENALNFAEIAASSFSPYGGSPCVISHVGNAPLKPTMISGYKYNATGIPWAVSGDMSNVYLLSVVG
jgi:hypothetical protein